MDKRNESTTESQKQSADTVEASSPDSVSAAAVNLDADSTATTSEMRNQLHPIKFKYADSFPVTYITSVIAATNAEVVTYPFDLTKTRLQIQGEAASKKPGVQFKYRGMIATAIGIAKEEGILKLYQGFSPAVYRHVVYSGVRICTYDYLRKAMTINEDGVDLKLPLWKSASCGILAGCFAQWLASPADLIKVQIQMEGKRRLMGEPPRVLGVSHAFREIVRKGGYLGLWKGCIPNVQRAALVNLGDLTAYDVSKQWIMEHLGMPDCRTVHVLASICAGFVAAGLGTPADVIKTRVMNQPTDDKGRGILYKGSVDCLRQTVDKEGFFALYKGFLPCWIRLAPWALTFWVSFETIRSWMGVAGY